MKDFHKEILNVKLGLKKKEEALEELRRGLVNAMRLGSNFVINIDILDDIKWLEDWSLDTHFPIQ